MQSGIGDESELTRAGFVVVQPLVVNGRFQVYGIDNLRIADASVMPRITTSNTPGDLCNHWRARRPADPRDIRNLMRGLVRRSGGRSGTRFCECTLSFVAVPH
ncbi:GMC oxidoreductase [Bradyrhizobium sp. UFLA05-109]